MELNDTICAPATIPGTGAITVIRVSGPDTFTIADRIFQGKHQRVSEAGGYTILYGTIRDPWSEASLEAEVVDEVLLSVFRKPHSYTGEDSVEISCHASSYIASRILSLLCKAGARMAEPGEFTRRAFINGKMDLAQAEAVADVISSSSAAAHRIAMAQLKGGYSQELSEIRAALVELTSLLELELDFSEEEVEFADRQKLLHLLETASARIRSLAGSFRLGNTIKNGVPIAIVGEPNVGKSTLLNALVGEDRALVSDQAGTTRDSIEECVVLDGIAFRFIDTAGLRESQEEVELMGMERTRQMISKAEIVLAVADASQSPAAIRQSVEALAAQVDFQTQKMLVLLNKCDLNKNVKVINTIVSSSVKDCITLIISAREGAGLPQLRKTLVELIKDRLPDSAEAVMVTNARHYESLRQTAASLDAARSALEQGIPSDLVAQDLRSALHSLGTITGEVTTDEVLGMVFSRFCIGK